MIVTEDLIDSGNKEYSCERCGYKWKGRPGAWKHGKTMPGRCPNVTRETGEATTMREMSESERIIGRVGVEILAWQ